MQKKSKEISELCQTGMDQKFDRYLQYKYAQYKNWFLKPILEHKMASVPTLSGVYFFFIWSIIVQRS